MLDSTYADRAFSDNIQMIAECSKKSTDALEAIANHLGVIVGILKMQNSMVQLGKDGIARPVFQNNTHVDGFAQPVI